VVFCNEKIKVSLNNEIKNYIEKSKIRFITLEINSKYDNIYLLALFAYFFDINSKIVKESLAEIFSRK
jgi:hypothetical protein